MDKKTKRCPFCGEEILAEAKKCKYCKEFLPQETDGSNGDSTQNIALENNAPDTTQNNAQNDTQNTTQNTTENATENTAQNTTQSAETSANNTNNPNVQKKIPVAFVVVAAVVLVLILCYIAGSDSIYTGCRPGDPQISLYSTVQRWYCDKNPYYDKIVVSKSNQNTYNNSYYMTKKYKDEDDFPVGQMTRGDGQNVCRVYAISGVTTNCNEKKLYELIKESSKRTDLVYEHTQIKNKIMRTRDNIKLAIQDYSRMLERTRQFRLPTNCDSMVAALQAYPNTRNKVTNISNANDICQVQFSNDTFAVFNPNISKLSVYGGINDPKLYATYKVELQVSDFWPNGALPILSYIDEVVVPSGIGDIKKIRKLTEEEQDAEYQTVY